MNNILSSEQKTKTGNLDSNLMVRHNKLDLMPRFMEIKSLKHSLGQNQLAKKLAGLSSTLGQNRNESNMLSPHTIPSNNHKRRQRISNTNFDDN